MKTQTVHFTVDGEGFTELIRNIWEEGRPTKALELVQSGLGMSESLLLQIIDGKRKLGNEENDPGALFLVDDNAKPISLSNITKNIENDYKKYFGRLSSMKRTHMLYCGTHNDENEMVSVGLATADAGKYRKTRSKSEKQKIQDLESKLSEIGKELEYVYKLQDKSIAQFITSLAKPEPSSFSEVEEREIEQSNNRYYEPTFYSDSEIKSMEEEENEAVKPIESTINEEDEYSKFLEFYEEYQKKVSSFNERMKDESLIAMSDSDMEELSELSSSYAKAIHFSNRNRKFNGEITVPHPNFVDARTPIDHAYILPNGRLYPVSFMGHHYLEDDLKDLGLIPKEGFGSFGSVEWTKLGWIKISSCEIMDLNPPYHGGEDFESHVHYPRPEVQWRTLKTYLESRDWESFRTSGKTFDSHKEIYKYLRTQENIWFDRIKK